MNTTEDAAPKRRGRPASGKRGTFSFRVTDSLRAKLEAESARTGRPVTEEIEMRLEASFAHASPHTVPVLGLLGSTVGLVEQMMGGTWRDDPAIADAVCAAINEVLDRFVREPEEASGGTAVQRVAAALLRQEMGTFGQAIARQYIGVQPSNDDERRAVATSMESVVMRRAALDPGFRQKLVQYVEENKPRKSK